MSEWNCSKGLFDALCLLVKQLVVAFVVHHAAPHVGFEAPQLGHVTRSAEKT